MHNIGARPAHQALEGRVEMQVVAAVEHHRQSDQLIAGGKPSFEPDNADARFTPGGRHGDDQLDIRQGSQFFALLLVCAVDQRFGEHQNAHRVNWNCYVSLCRSPAFRAPYDPG
jgi:hypothetical protein